MRSLVEIEDWIDGLDKRKAKISRNYKKWCYSVLGLVVFFCMGSSLALPLFDNKSGFEVIQSLMDGDKNSIVLGDEVNNTPAYIYHTTPDNAFGNGDFRTVNWSFFLGEVPTA